MDVVLRNELPDDYREVENLTREAFWNVYCPGCSEHYLLNVMRQSPDFIDQLDIVAECDGCIVGNVVVWYLGVAVALNQRQIPVSGSADFPGGCCVKLLYPLSAVLQNIRV